MSISFEDLLVGHPDSRRVTITPAENSDRSDPVEFDGIVSLGIDESYLEDSLASATDRLRLKLSDVRSSGIDEQDTVAITGIDESYVIGTIYDQPRLDSAVISLELVTDDG